MKDITITGRVVKRELAWIIGCFLVAFFVNVYAVVTYDRPAIELFSQLGFVVVIAAVFYIATSLLRAILLLVLRVCLNLTHKK